MGQIIAGFVRSDKGVFIGDICYAMNENTYHKEWGDEHGFKDGMFTDERTGMRYVMAGTAYGDGSYSGSDGRNYPVDAGNIGVVPLEIADTSKRFREGLGRVVDGPVAVYFEAQDGVFCIAIGDEMLVIDTRYEEEDEEDEDE